MRMKSEVKGQNVEGRIWEYGVRSVLDSGFCSLVSELSLPATRPLESLDLRPLAYPVLNSGLWFLNSGLSEACV